MIQIVVTGAGRSVADPILERLASIDADFRLHLCDSMETAGEARRFKGRTLNIELASEMEIGIADLVLDLDHSYRGEQPVYRLPSPGCALLQRTVPESVRDAVTAVYGSIREPAAAIEQGVEALAGQVSELFNGRDPDPKQFGGTLAFNERILDPSEMVAAMQTDLGFGQAVISIERIQSDCFHTAAASLWLEGPEDAISAVRTMATENYPIGSGIAPNSGRDDADSAVRIAVREIARDRIHVRATGDLEYGIWAKAAHQAVLESVERMQ